jgi:hypothetical protein
MNYWQKISACNLQGIHQSLQYMPECTYQEFCQWVLDHSDLAEEWLQLSGIAGLNRLTFGMLDGLLTDDEFDQLIPYTVPVNVFNMYEIVADNLAIGLSYPVAQDKTYMQRRKIVSAVSSAMVARLRGADDTAVVNALTRVSGIREVSLFEQSLNMDKHRILADAFARETQIAPASLEYDLLPILIANVESCSQVVQNLNGYLSQELVRNGFVRRFAGINRLLDDTYIPRHYLVQIGMNTIMTVPIVGYFIAVIAEEIRLLPNYDYLCDSGYVLKALEDMSVMVRLLNDIGPFLLEQPKEEYGLLVKKMRALQDQHKFKSFYDLMLCTTEYEPVKFTRLKKDLKYREFNLALYQPCRSNSVSEAIEVFHDQLKYLSSLYQRRATHLRTMLDIISFETQSEIIAEVIRRFIKFHEMLYRASFDQTEGEFAV